MAVNNRSSCRTVALALLLVGCGSDPTAGTSDASDTTRALDITSADSDDTLVTSATDTGDTTASDSTTSDAAPDTSTPGPVMKLHVLDVGQGDALIVELPCGAMLVDTGGETTAASGGSPGFDSDDALEAQLAAFFASRPDLHDTLDVVVLTHPHLDHTHGVPRLIDMVEAGHLHILNVVTNGDESGFDSGLDEQIQLHDFADADPSIGRWYVLQRKTTAAGFTNDIIDPFGACAAGGGLDPSVTALWGRIDQDNPLSATWDPADLDNANNHSVVLRVQLGQGSMLLTGDLEEAGIAALIAQYKDTGLLDVDVYKVGHHGSYNGTTAALVNLMTPRVAVISSGPDDRIGTYTAYAYGHPRWHAVSDLLGDVDSHGVTGTRPLAIDAPVATAYADDHGIFEPIHVARAVYCTGWEHHAVVVTVHADGTVDAP